MVQGINVTLNAIWWHTPLSCEAVLLSTDVTVAVLEAVTASFSAFRTYAIDGHQIIPALLVLILGLAPVTVNIFIYTRDSDAFITYVGSYPLCDYNVHRSIAIENKRELEKFR
ncbi:uncharacterized protein LAESUDRAFT_728672 [Laetiporus sulphureus 93-53]|uniref:Uncharacterized protein n=1 Tax=Laetiporus sulphureus 93-53 TaxID=1314785 RepID=A0A165D1I8_9APHY|nr:uncharacterized protein LAESUDRAFT_728672 [Laetiporus sulphureus 93-53]KZT03960.1 hypothetical protein LAESUDRAFT_728672 [Laetiporus sulphureus 93-53]